MGNNKKNPLYENSLSDMEKVIRDILVINQKPMYFRELYAACKNQGHYWAKQSLNTFLLRLIGKGAISAVREESGLKLYSANLSRIDLIREMDLDEFASFTKIDKEWLLEDVTHDETCLNILREKRLPNGKTEI